MIDLKPQDLAMKLNLFKASQVSEQRSLVRFVVVYITRKYCNSRAFYVDMHDGLMTHKPSQSPHQNSCNSLVYQFMCFLSG